MKHFIFIFSVFAFANCQLNNQTIDHQNRMPQKGLEINTSTTFKNGEYQLITNDLYEKVITIQGDSLTIDFNDLQFVGTDDLTKPNEFKGVAVHIKNSKNVTIKNLNIIGYRIALQVDSVIGLTIDSCDFSFNYRADSLESFDINRVEEGAIVINDSKFINIKNSTISNNYNGIVLNNGKAVNIGQSKIQFHSKVGIWTSKHSYLGEIFDNQLDWNLAALNWDISEFFLGIYFKNSITHNGFVFVNQKHRFRNDFTASDIDFDVSEERQLSNIPQIASKYPKGEIYKIPTKYGVYNFEYPAMFLRINENNQYTFAMFGPTVGNWKFVNAKNVKSTNLKRGTFPATFVIEKENMNEPFSIEFEFIGERFQDEFGVWNEKGEVFRFGYKE